MLMSPMVTRVTTCPLMMALGAAYRLEGPDGSRDVAATDFYQGA